MKATLNQYSRRLRGRWPVSCSAGDGERAAAARGKGGKGWAAKGGGGGGGAAGSRRAGTSLFFVNRSVHQAKKKPSEGAYGAIYVHADAHALEANFAPVLEKHPDVIVFSLWSCWYSSLAMSPEPVHYGLRRYNILSMHVLVHLVPDDGTGNARGSARLCKEQSTPTHAGPRSFPATTH